MKYWTYAEIKAKVQKDLGIEQETFVKPTELMGYCNAAIDEAEAEIHGIYEDYFLNKAPISLVKDQSDYTLPSDIYATKIRSIIFNDGSKIYPVKKMKETDKFEDIMCANDSPDSDPYYKYIILNTGATDGVKLHLVPIAQKDVTSALTVWYIRNANRITADTDVCDIPEFIQFVMQFMKVRIYEKEMHPNLTFAIGALEQQRKLMVDTLTGMIPDGDNEVEKDLTHYAESV